MKRMSTLIAVLLLAAFCWLGMGPTEEDPAIQVRADARTHLSNAIAVGHSSFMSPHSSPIVVHGDRVFVVNTPADTVDVISAKNKRIVARVPVGIDPVSIAVRPDGRETWVSNHVSDSVSVIDSDPDSITYLSVIATIQDFDRATRATNFDEPVGIAFASNEKAYVALSSENKIAVVDVAARRVRRHLTINAQDPRAIEVRGNRLYVIPFESNNKSQLSGGTGELDREYETFDAHKHSIAVNNVLSLGHVTDIIKHPNVPDRDLYVFDTETDELVEVVDSLGTLLYGLAVDSHGTVFVAQTDARNDANGRAGTKKHGLKELENRAFLNQLTAVEFDGDEPGSPEFIDLEPLPPQHPSKETALATPFAIQVSDDDTTLFVSAAGSDKVFSVDVASGEVVGRVKVGAVPRGIALQSDENDESRQAWVLNAVSNTVSLLDTADREQMQVLATVVLEDPTDSTVKKGRMAFNSAAASTTGTFSCASCHPDGHTDQLLWVLQTPIVTGGNQIMPRSTMPIRGLRDTEPFHWDGIPGDPYGGNNSASIRSHVEPNSDVNNPVSSTRHLIDGGLATTMMMVGDETVNDRGQKGELDEADRDAMAKFLLSVSYPPAQRRAYTNELSARARSGFDLFHIKGDLQPKRNVCGDCHRMPFWVSTNTPGTGMDAPTWRGAYDRWLILPQGRLNIIDFDFYRGLAERGAPERGVWRLSWAGRRRFDPVWDMVLEGSTGFSGTFARQVTLNKATSTDSFTLDLLDALEQSAAEGGIVLAGEGLQLKGKRTHSLTLQYAQQDGEGAYYSSDGDRKKMARSEMVESAAAGHFIVTLTGHMLDSVDYTHPQPALWTLGPIHSQRGRQKFPVLSDKSLLLKMSGRHIEAGAHVIVDGRRCDGLVELDDGVVEVELAQLPEPGMHLLQLQNPGGLFSNDFIFHVANPDAPADGKSGGQ